VSWVRTTLGRGLRRDDDVSERTAEPSSCARFQDDAQSMIATGIHYGMAFDNSTYQDLDHLLSGKIQVNASTPVTVVVA
jgi:hypothetical protein